jgi:DNA-directed RNA polymerase I, II, and III subunit RPABC2
MPPKKRKPTNVGKIKHTISVIKPTEKADDIDYGVDDQEIDQSEIDDVQSELKDEPVPDLAVIDPVQTLKERYEYKPVIRTQITFVTPENRITSEILTKFECADIISVRSKQIENGGMCFADVQELTDPLDMARKELIDKKCPLDVIRSITDKVFERWHVNEMVIPSDF